MRRMLGILLVMLTVAAAYGQGDAKDKPTAKPLRVLVTYGGHGFTEKPFWKMFDELEGIKYDRCKLPDEFDKLKPGLEKKYDVIVRFDMVKNVPAKQCEAFAKLLKESGIGLVSWHHNLGAHPDWAEYRDIVGGSYVFEPFEVDGKRYEKSIFRHWKSTTFKSVEPEHPIVKGIKEFKIEDGGETYGKCYVAKDVKVLLTTDQQETTPEQIWTKRYGKSRVCHIMPGHGPMAWKVPEFRTILTRAIVWSNQRD